MIDVLEEPILTDEEERRKQNEIDREELLSKYQKCVDKIEECIEQDGNAYQIIDEVRFFIKELRLD